MVSQKVQLLVMSKMAEDLGGKIVYYTAEDFYKTLASQAVIREKVNQKQKFSGVIFYRLQQFNYGDRFNFEMLEHILKSGYEVHFAQDIFSVYTLDEFHQNYCLFSLFEKTRKISFQSILSQVDSSTRQLF